MKIKVRYFASVREALGPGESLQIAEGATVASVRDQLIGRRGRSLRAALDQVLCDDSAAVRDGAELAFFPPVTGG